METARPRRAKDALALALDVADPDAAFALAERLREYFGVVKVGLELYSVAGPDIVRSLIAADYAVFLDLKFHDIPTTVRRAARAVAQIGVTFLTVHTVGGGVMLEAAVAGLTEGANAAGLSTPIGLGVTVLTSDPTPPPALLAERAALAARSGLGGVVCAAPDLRTVRDAAPGLATVVPGTREPNWARDDQQRVMTPAQAIRLGADLLVIGRGVSAAGDPEEQAVLLVESVADALAARESTDDSVATSWRK
jgi:orotidine-5'-phosphate decarboxylase